MYTVAQNNFTPFTGSRTVSALGVTGTISNGQLNFSIGAPGQVHRMPMAQLFGASFPSIPLNVNTNVMVSAIVALDVAGNERLQRGFSEEGMPSNEESVAYVWVSGNVIVSSPGGTVTEDGRTDNIEPFTLEFRAGWNAFHVFNKRHTLYCLC